MIVEATMNPYETTGTITADGGLVLDAPVPMAAGKVRITVQPQPEQVPPPKMSLSEYLEALRIRQEARGHVPRTREEIDASLREERESWD
ncbi:MAG: hypothetical protein U0791_11710 [Gemmataceae bacterium]